MPVRVLACQLEPWFGFDELAINPADSPRAGPYTLQTDPVTREPTDPGKAWLLLGGPPGLAIDSHDRGETPEVEFTARAVELDEGDYLVAPR